VLQSRSWAAQAVREEALERLPDKSSFIRGAIEKALHEPCPACGGKGLLDCDSARWLAELLAANEAKTCACCDSAFPPEEPVETEMDVDEAEEAVCGHCGPEGHVH